MRYVGAFTPQVAPTGTFNLTTARGKVKFSNESCQNLLITFADGSSDKVPAGFEYLFCITQSGTSITYKTLSSLNIPCIDAVDVTIYDPGEEVPGTYPAPLVRQTIVGNSINLATSTTNLVNDGNPAGTQIIEATVSGDGSSAVSVTNDGVVALGNALRPGKLIINNNGEVDTNTVVSPADGASVLSVTAGKTRLQNSAVIAFQVPSGTDRANITNSAFQLLDTTVFKGLTGDSIARFGSASGTGTGTFNHTLGATPDFAAITTHSGGGTQTVGYDSENATQFHVDTGAGQAWFAFLTKRT